MTSRGRRRILFGGVLLAIGIGCSLGSNYYQVKAIGDIRQGQLMFGPETGSPAMREKGRQVTYSDWLFYIGLGLTGIGILLQTWGSMFREPAPAPVAPPGATVRGNGGHLESGELENIRVGYKAAIDLWNTSGNQNWSRFNAMLVANSVVLAVIGNATVDDLLGWQARVALTLVGLVFCGCWWAAVDRGLIYQDHYVAGALGLERYLAPVTVVEDGRHLQMAGLASMRTRHAMRTVILVFSLLYLAAGGWILWKHICV